MRSYRDGMSITFRQDGSNLICSADNVLAREQGNDSLMMNSLIDVARSLLFAELSSLEIEAFP